MKISLGRIILLVNDYDKALKFYEENLDAKILSDSPSKSGKRYLHIGFEGGNSGIWFLKAETPEQQEHVGRQTGGTPSMVFYTNDLEELYQRLMRNKVKISKQPVNEEGFSFLHFLDLYGNEIVLVQLD